MTRDPAMPQEGRFIETPDGLKLFLRDLPPEGEPVGPPALCLHGLTRNSRDFETVAPRIAKGGRRAIALDVRGRGYSDRDPDPARYHPAIYAQDVLHVLRALGIERAAFIGTSMGGLITMTVAALAPQVIERATLNDIGPVLDPTGLARIGGYVGKTGLFADWAAAEAAMREINGPAFPGAPDALFAAMARRQCREVEAGVAPDYDPAIAAAFAQPTGAADLWPLFAALAPIPTLVVRGALSDLLSAATVAEMQARKPDLVAMEQPGVGHAPYLDEPEAWAALSAFLALRG